MTIRVCAPSRLHFGLVSLPGRRGLETRAEREETRAKREEIRAERKDQEDIRHYGGAGLMVERPGLELTIEEAACWSTEGPLAERAMIFARRFVDSFPAGLVRPQRITVHSAPAEHVGLGTGTQLGMAVAQALALASGLTLTGAELAQRVGRGLRSSLGVHGFAQGGFLVDGGKRAGEGIAPLAARIAFPQEWRVVLVIPRHEEGLHGVSERLAFERLHEQPWPLSTTDMLCRLILLGMLPALSERDWHAFGQALYEFNRRVGELFRPVQRGVYADETIAAIVGFVRQHGVPGVGQSSWGPTAFAVAEDEMRAEDLAARIRAQFGLEQREVFCVQACNRGAGYPGAGGALREKE